MTQSHYEYRGQATLWWFNKANDLRGAAAAIWYAIESESVEIKEQYDLCKGYSFSIAAGGVFAMNAGLSLELLFKACWLLHTEKNFKQIPSHHNLVRLAEVAGLLPHLNKNHRITLEVLSEYIVWIGKYPVAKTEDKYFNGIDVANKCRKRISKIGSLSIESSDEQTIPNWRNYNRIWNIASSEYWQQKEIKRAH